MNNASPYKLAKQYGMDSVTPAMMLRIPAAITDLHDSRDPLTTDDVLFIAARILSDEPAKFLANGGGQAARELAKRMSPDSTKEEVKEFLNGVEGGFTIAADVARTRIKRAKRYIRLPIATPEPEGDASDW